MANKRTDSNAYTIIFAIGMVVIVGALLAFFASATQDMRNTNNKVKTQMDILAAMNVESSRDNAAELFNTHIKKQFDIVGTTATENSEAFMTNIKKEQAKAKLGEEAKWPLFVGERKGEKVYVVPVRGAGLWGAVWGYISLKGDLETIDGVYFDHAAETPGLGSNITEPFFTEDFKGEKITDANGKFAAVAISKSNGDPLNEDKSDNEVDAIGGATITGNGVGAMIKSGLKVYVPYFETLKK